MAYESTIPAAKQALDTLLRAHTWPATPPAIRWGAPTKEEEAAFELVYQADAEPREDEYLVLGGLRVDENYELVVVVDVHQYGNDEQATELRAWQLADQVIGIVDEHNTLSGAVNRITGFNRRPVNAPGGPQTWRTRIEVRISAVGHVHP